jgi:hypothetical protein
MVPFSAPSDWRCFWYLADDVRPDAGQARAREEGVQVLQAALRFGQVAIARGLVVLAQVLRRFLEAHLVGSGQDGRPGGDVPLTLIEVALGFGKLLGAGGLPDRLAGDRVADPVDCPAAIEPGRNGFVVSMMCLPLYESVLPGE